jgi:hypothetical protein
VAVKKEGVRTVCDIVPTKEMVDQTVCEYVPVKKTVQVPCYTSNYGGCGSCGTSCGHGYTGKSCFGGFFGGCFGKFGGCFGGCR